MINLSKTLFIVDGRTESLSFKDKFQKEFNSTTNFRKAVCNGKSVTAKGYVSAISGTLKLELNNSYIKIICVLDKERRKMSSLSLAKSIKKEIINQLNTQFSQKELESKISVVVADTCFENWIIADIEGIKKTNMILPNVIQENYDGKSGVAILKKIMNIPYKKTIHGPKLFKIVDFDNAIKYSPSFNQLYKTITIT